MNNTYKISPSLMCANLLDLKTDIDILLQEGIDSFHIDIMDGHFVRNITLGFSLCRAISNYASITLDIHLMVDNVMEVIDQFDDIPNCIIGFHPETVDNPLQVIKDIHKRKHKVSIAVGPELEMSNVKSLIYDIDMLIVMTVYPGFAGQKMIPEGIDRIKVLSNLARAMNKKIDIEVDGNVTWDSIENMRSAGANSFVGGSSSIFQNGTNLRSNVCRFKNIMNHI